jgi:HlyD family secretion protein
VKAGALLVRFESNDLTAQPWQALAEVEQQRANLSKLTRGNRPEEIEQAEANALALRADYQAAEADAVNAQAGAAG